VEFVVKLWGTNHHLHSVKLVSSSFSFYAFNHSFCFGFDFLSSEKYWWWLNHHRSICLLLVPLMTVVLGRFRLESVVCMFFRFRSCSICAY
jgi:hypothetical protein